MIVKLLTERHYNRDAFKVTMKKAWRPARDIRFRDLNTSLTLIEFEDRRDKDRVIREGPWSFDKHLVLLQEVDGSQQVHQIKLTEALFWVRLHDLPLIARNEYIGNLIGRKIGRVEEVDLEKGEMAWGEYMRVCVCIDVTKPLLRGKKINIGSAEPIWVRFSYKSLPNFCYCCEKQKNYETQDFPYRQWMRAANQGGRSRE